ncbi:MAG TPA: Na+/H+ antiporter NhaA [Thermoleophilaceae bacterium]|nr:Na+/H+ antiporter NhaA [Thermoleophilaceae bacterium]
MADEQPADQDTQDEASELHGDSYSGSATRQTLARLRGPLRDYLSTETGGALFLLGAAVLALLWANISASTYQSVWTTDFSLRLGDHVLTEDLRHWVNDGLMAIFFFVVGLEARREFDLGELRDRHRMPLPALAALAGMVLPVGIYLAFNAGSSSASGWGVAMSTDTAFALGLLALVGPRLSARVRAFMVTAAVVDDLLALGVIAVAYTENLDVVALLVGVALFGLILVVRAFRLRYVGPYAVLGVATWIAMHYSGIDPVIVGLGMGLLTYAYPASREDLERATTLFRDFREQPTPELARTASRSLEMAISPNDRLARRLHPWSSYVIVPLFALANAGIQVNGGFLGRAFSSPITWGIIVGYVVGKPLGITGGALLAERLTRGRVKSPVGRGALLGVGAAAGVGFTVSLLIASRAFSGDDLREATLGVLCAAVLSSIVSWAIFAVIDRLPYRRRLRLLVGRSEGLVDLAADIDPDEDHIRGPDDAPVTLVEYGDFECPYCGRAEPWVRRLLADSGDEIRYVFRHLPLSDVHEHAQLAAEAAEAAGAQGRFWEMHDLLFDHQDALTGRDLMRYAEELGLDVDRFHKDLRDHEHAPRVARDVESAELSGVAGTPTFFVNGQRHHGAYDVETLKKAVKAARARTLVAA